MGMRSTRRGFMKGAAAVCGAAAMAGCAKSTGLTAVTPAKAPEEEVLVHGSAPNNCGGKCVLTAHVQKGVIKRVTTDERKDQNLIDGFSVSSPQRRACVRCRAKAEWINRSDRLLYPMKQTKKRGDLSGFVRVSWEQAFKEIAEKMEAIKASEKKRLDPLLGGKATGCEGFYFHNASGDGATFPRSRPTSGRMLDVFGGSFKYRDDYSYPCHYVAGRFGGGTGSALAANSNTDAVHAELLVLWSWNGAECIMNTNSLWYATQARDMGVPIVSVDQWLSKSATTLSTGYQKDGLNVPPVVAPVSGTDAAMAAAMMYHLVEKYVDDAAFITFIKTYIHGFFDMPESKDPDGLDQSVPTGASYAAYLFGNSDFLVKKGLNKGKSVYPDKIGYNTRKYTINGAQDPLMDKFAPIYGQTPKTPEWAEKITGVPAQTIRDFAELLLSKKATIWFGGGFQRNTEGEQNIWSAGLLGYVTQNFGMPGASTGMSTTAPSGGAGGLSEPKLAGEYTTTDANIKVLKGFNTSKVTNTKRGFGASVGDTTLPVFLWLDAIENGGTGRSRWGSPEVAKGPGYKVMMNFAGNLILNQGGDVEECKRVMAMTDKCELVVSADLFMTPSSLYADYLFPAAMPFEKTFVTNMDEAFIISPQAIEPPGEVKSDFDMLMGIAKAFGKDSEMFKVTHKAGTVIDGKALTEDVTASYYKDEETIKALYANTGYETKMGMTFDQLKKAGILSFAEVSKDNIINKGFRDDPVKNKLNTQSGKFEAYSRACIENYETRGYNNVDDRVALANSGKIITKASTSNKGRFVYPIPMYIPLVEGLHACDNDASVPAWTGKIDNSKANGATKHPDCLGSNAKGYTMRLHTWHMQYRAHSSLNSSGLLTEIYKKDSAGKPTFASSKRGQDKVMGPNAVVYDENIYEPAYLNKVDADRLGLPANGALVHIYNDRSAIRVYAMVNPIVHPGEIMLGQGSWTVTETVPTRINGRDYYVDRGGCANSLNDLRPSRICQGMTLASDCRVGIEIVRG